MRLFYRQFIRQLQQAVYLDLELTFSITTASKITTLNNLLSERKRPEESICYSVCQ